MIHSKSVWLVLVSCSSLANVGLAQTRQAEEDPVAQTQGEDVFEPGQPNWRFADLLSGVLFNVRFGSHVVRYGKEITIEGVASESFGNTRRGAWRRAILEVMNVDGIKTDRERTVFHILGPETMKTPLTVGSVYRLTGAIRDSVSADGRSLCSFELSAPPQAIADVDPYAGQESLKGTSFTSDKLDELVGHDVELTGNIWSLNDHWWFEHGGTRMAVSRIKRCPGWDAIGHGFLVAVRGRLEKELRPSLEQISQTPYRDLVPQYVFKRATLEVRSVDYAGLFYSEVYNASPRFSDGVLALHDEIARTYNLLPSMNRAMLLSWRNARLINEIAGRDSPYTRTVLRKRMQDKDSSAELGLLYAGILAAAGDEAGRQFLLAGAGDLHSGHLDSVFWVLGNLQRLARAEPSEPSPDALSEKPALPREEPSGELDMAGLIDSLMSVPLPPAPTTVDLTWAEEVMISALASDEVTEYAELTGHKNTATCSSLAIEHGAFAEHLVYMRSDKGTASICEKVRALDAALTRKNEQLWSVRELRDRLLQALMVVNHPAAIEMARAIVERDYTDADIRQADSSIRRASQAFLMRHNRELAINSLIESLDQWYALHALLTLDRGSVLGPLQAKLPQLTGEASRNGRILVLLLSEDPAAALLDSLAAEDCPSRSTVLYWLAARTNDTVARRVAHLLRSAPVEFFNAGEFINTQAVEHAIDACSLDGSLIAVGQLISLLDSHLGRFDVYATDDAFNKLVAARLIELTDVSFGVDKSKWEDWFATQKPDPR